MDAHKNPNPISLSSSQDLKKTHEEFFIKNLKESSFFAAEEGDYKTKKCTTTTTLMHKEKEASRNMEESGRERLKRHRVEMSGRVWIPDIWGQEDDLVKWIDCTVFDSCLEKSSIMSAREALIQEGRRSTMMSARRSVA